MSCLCPACTPTPAPTFTEEFRLACEARWVVSHDKEWRTEYYAKVRKARGASHANLLIHAVNEVRKTA